ncbi:MAG TPA: CVNH domain-containing protein [Rhizomicrobium sp.]|nr:CVNH domain-containing protein [Rhizomicrobium sp.]
MRNLLGSISVVRAYALAALFVFCGTLTSSAGGNPPGSYQESCKDVSYQDTAMKAECKNDDGNYVEASVPYPGFCQTGFENSNGKLQCILPPGDYRTTCHDKTLVLGILKARCDGLRGTNSTSLMIAGICPKGPIHNLGGQLYCNYFGPSNLPAKFQGSYSQTCGDIAVSGTMITAVCETASGSVVQATLNVGASFCLFGISNNNGTLVCNTPENPPPPCTGPGCAVPNGQTTPEAGCSAPNCPRQ